MFPCIPPPVLREASKTRPHQFLDASAAIAHMDLVSPEGLRQDGRRALELRSLSIRTGVLGGADGSAVIRSGQTVVVAGVFGPHPLTALPASVFGEPGRGGAAVGSAPGCHSHEFHVRGDSQRPVDAGAAADGASADEPSSTSITAELDAKAVVAQNQVARLNNRAVITCEYAIAPFAGAERRAGDIGGKDRASQDAAVFIRETMDQAILAHLFPRSQVDIRVQVLQSDGNALCAAVNAVSIALIHAGVPLEDMVCACDVVIAGDELLVDANQPEQVASGAELVVSAFASSRKVVSTQMVSKIPVDVFSKALDVAVRGCDRVHELLREQLETSVLEHSLVGHGAQLKQPAERGDSERRRSLDGPEVGSVDSTTGR
jgi:exosome complex component RRP41